MQEQSFVEQLTKTKKTKETKKKTTIEEHYRVWCEKTIKSKKLRSEVVLVVDLINRIQI